MPKRSLSSCENWFAASIPSALSLFLGCSAIAETRVAFRKLASPGDLHAFHGSETTADAQSLPVIAGVQTGIEAYVEYELATCALVSDGNYTSPIAPTHGTLTYGTVQWSLITDDHCNGTVLSWGAAYYTWTGSTQSGATAPTDSFELQWTTPDGTASETNDFDVVLGPRILLYGVDVTDTKEPVEVAAGQQISLSVSTSTQGGLNPTWSVSGATIDGFSPTGAAACNAQVPCPAPGPTPAENASQSLSFYWISAGKDGSKDQTVHYSYQTANGQTGEASARFKVLGPSQINIAYCNSASLPCNSTVDVRPFNGSQVLTFGYSNNGQPGITLSTSAISPQGYSGSFEWTQIITRDDIYAKEASVTYYCTDGLGDDGGYPYTAKLNPVGQDPGVQDTPAVPFSWTAVPNPQIVWTRQSFKTYLLWNSKTYNSIPVPLASVPWGWSGKASRPGGTWHLVPGSGKGGLEGPVTISTAFPQWDMVITDPPPPYSCSPVQSGDSK